jgi:hypothetical protein
MAPYGRRPPPECCELRREKKLIASAGAAGAAQRQTMAKLEPIKPVQDAYKLAIVPAARQFGGRPSLFDRRRVESQARASPRVTRWASRGGRQRTGGADARRDADREHNWTVAAAPVELARAPAPPPLESAAALARRDDKTMSPRGQKWSRGRNRRHLQIASATCIQASESPRPPNGDYDPTSRVHLAQRRRSPTPSEPAAVSPDKYQMQNKLIGSPASRQTARLLDWRRWTLAI